jgi:phosphoglycolate phosphatase
MNDRTLTVLITDLDNTVWNWFEIWYATFSALLDGACRIAQLPRETLLQEIRAVHQKHGTSEYTFLLQELPSLLARHSVDEIPTVYASAIEDARRARAATLRTYDGVLETLDEIRKTGALVVAYTESQAFWTSHRLKQTDLDLRIDYLYSAPDHDLPLGVSAERLRSNPEEYYRLRRTEHRHTPRGALKPDARILQKILEDVHASPEATVYVGDSLMKDIAMAQAVGVLDIWAKYGEAHTRAEYDLLRAVSHWTPEVVERERRLSHEDVKASVAIRGFDALSWFRFGPHR